MGNSKYFKKHRCADLWRKTNGKCSHCGKSFSSKYQTIDHYVPRVIGGTYDQRNLFPLCYSCNQNRGARKIDPRKYYKYATEEMILDCLAYEEEFKKSRTSADGTMWY